MIGDMMGKFEVYQDKNGEWRWRYVQKGHIMADSSEGYATEFGAKRAIGSLRLKLPFATVTVLEDKE
jgi:uncharacterized protein YegP (UPF0339 family)